MEKKTQVVDKTRPPNATARLRELGALVTRKIVTSELHPRDLDSLIARIQATLGQLGRLYDADTLEELYTTAKSAIKCLFGVEHFVVLERRASGLFVPWANTRETGPPEGIKAAVQEMVKWAFEMKQVMFCELEEEERAPDDPSAAVGIMPISADHTHHCVLLFWIRDDLSETNVLQQDLLRNLARDLAARASTIIQASRLSTLSNLFDNIVESVPHAIIAVSGDDRVVAVNSNAEFLFGFQRIFVMDERYSEALPPQLVKVFGELMADDMIASGPVGDTEIELDVGGTTISIGISMSRLKARTGAPQGHLFLCRDLSLSREVQKLREVDALKSEFVNTVSHELKTPLTAILGGLEVMEYYVDDLDEDGREMLGVINDGAKRLRDLIFDLLDVSRLEAGKVELHDAPVAPLAVVKEALAVQQPHPSHEIVVEVSENLGEYFMDKPKMVQCVTNYVSNAIKYSPNGGKVTIRAEVNKTTRMLIFSVSDQGIGIPHDAQRRVWEKFYRVDASYTSEIEGTGLGLVIVKRIAELHGGTVWIESAPGKGSTFFIGIPARKPGGDGEEV